MLNMNLGTLFVEIRATAVQFYDTMNKMESRMELSSKKMQAFGKKMAFYITAPITAAVAVGLKNFKEFDDAMTQSLAIMGNVSKETRKQMEQTAREIAGKSLNSAASLAKAYYYLASAGLDAKQAIAALGAVDQFAVAGMFDLEKATTLLMDAQSALGLRSKDAVENMENLIRVSDVLAKANVLANANIEQFSLALTTKSAAALRLLNKDMEEGVAVLAAFADQGIKGEQAGERLSIALRDMQRASIVNREQWDRLGLTVYDTAGKMLPVADIVEQMEKHFAKLTDEEKKSTAELLGFQDRSFSAIQSLMGFSQKIRDYEAALRAAGGTCKETADKQMQAFSAQLNLTWKQLKTIAREIAVATLPAIKKVQEWIKGLSNWWKGLTDAQKENIAKWLLIAAAIGPALIILGKAISLIVALTNVLKTSVVVITFLVRQFITFGPVIAKTLIPIGLLVAAIIAVSEAFGIANFGFLEWIGSIRIGTGNIKIWIDAMAIKFLIFCKRITTDLGIAWQYIRYIFQVVYYNVLSFFSELGKGVNQIFWGLLGVIWDVCKEMLKPFEMVVDGILSLLEQVGIMSEATHTAAMASLKNAIQTPTNFIEDQKKQAEDYYDSIIEGNNKAIEAAGTFFDMYKKEKLVYLKGYEEGMNKKIVQDFAGEQLKRHNEELEKRKALESGITEELEKEIKAVLDLGAAEKQVMTGWTDTQLKQFTGINELIMQEQRRADQIGLTELAAKKYQATAQALDLIMTNYESKVKELNLTEKDKIELWKGMNEQGKLQILELNELVEKTYKLEQAEKFQMDVAEMMGRSFEDILVNMDQLIKGTYKWSDAFQDLARSLARVVIEYAVIKPLISSMFPGATSATVTPATPSASAKAAQGMVMSAGQRITPFAGGGVVSSPVMFGMAGGKVGLAGESGAEGILPLKRGKGGMLGVMVEGARGGNTIQQEIIFNFPSVKNPQDFRLSEQQVARRISRSTREAIE